MINTISEIEQSNITAEEWAREEEEYRALLTDDSYYEVKILEKRECQAELDAKKFYNNLELEEDDLPW